jgi:hypothetical protein
MIQKLEIGVLGLFILGIMFYFCIDVIKRNKIISQSNPNEKMAAAVYPLYVDCSPNTNHSHPIKENLITVEHFYYFNTDHISCPVDKNS